MSRGPIGLVAIALILAACAGGGGATPTPAPACPSEGPTATSAQATTDGVTGARITVGGAVEGDYVAAKGDVYKVCGFHGVPPAGVGGYGVQLGRGDVKRRGAPENGERRKENGERIMKNGERRTENV